MSTRVPAESFPPGEFLKSELDTRGWSQIELAEILDRPPRLISEIIKGKRSITPETAKGLAAALGTSAELWMNLESKYQLARTTIETSSVSRRARLYKTFPVKELIRRKWVKSADTLDALEMQCCRFFGVASPDETLAFQHAAKKQSYDDPPHKLQLAWLIRAKQIAEPLRAAVYSLAALREAIKELKTCLRDIDGVKKVEHILAKAGVRFVIVEYLPGAKLDGACFWINKGKSPVIALSLRLDRVDNFWHTLFHEIDHILNGEGKDEPIVDVFDRAPANSEAPPEIESRANSAAAHYCIDAATLRNWLHQLPRAPTKAQILDFAESVDVHPGIVVGQLQHLDVIPYSFHRDLLEKVRETVINSAQTDGFRS